MNPASNVEYRGSQNSEIISQPAPPSRTADRDRRADGILAKDPEERRVDPKTNHRKVAAAFEDYFEKDAFAKLVRAVKGRKAVKPKPTPKKVTPKAKTKSKPKEAPKPKPKAESKGKSEFKTVAGKKGKTIETSYGNLAQNEHGELGVATGKGGFRPLGNSAEDQKIRSDITGELTNMHRHYMGVARGVRQDTAANRMKARAGDLLGGKSFASQMVTSTIGMGVADTALRAIPTGTDEYGNRTTLADSTVGQIATPIIGIMGAQAAPGAVANMTRHRPGALSNIHARAAGTPVTPSAAGAKFDAAKQKVNPVKPPKPNTSGTPASPGAPAQGTTGTMPKTASLGQEAARLLWGTA